MGEHIQLATTTETVCFYSEGRIVLLYTDAKRKFFIDYTMSELENTFKNYVETRIRQRNNREPRKNKKL